MKTVAQYKRMSFKELFALRESTLASANALESRRRYAEADAALAEARTMKIALDALEDERLASLQSPNRIVLRNGTVIRSYGSLA